MKGGVMDIEYMQIPGVLELFERLLQARPLFHIMIHYLPGYDPLPNHDRLTYLTDREWDATSPIS
jgi:hypothetical protein